MLLGHATGTCNWDMLQGYFTGTFYWNMLQRHVTGTWLDPEQLFPRPSQYCSTSLLVSFLKLVDYNENRGIETRQVLSHVHAFCGM